MREEPKSEANFCERKRALFTGEGAQYGGAETHRPPRRTKNNFFFKYALVISVFLLAFPAPPLSVNVSHAFIRCLKNLF